MRILTFSKKGYTLGKQLRQKYPHAKLYGMKRDIDEEGLPYDPTAKTISKYGMYLSETMIFISSVGIASRMIDGNLRHKSVDSPVIVINDQGEFVIPVLSGHLGKGNELACDIAEYIGGRPVITTATDGLGIIAVDLLAESLGLRIRDFSLATKLTARRLQDESIYLYPKGNYPQGYIGCEDKSKADIVIGSEALSHQLQLVRPNYVLGIGCRKDYDRKTMESFVMKTLDSLGIASHDVSGIVSHERKKDEEAIIALGQVLQVPFDVYSTEEMIEYEEYFEGSDFVKKTLGVKSVCEIAGFLGSHSGKCILPKCSHHGMTLSIWEKMNED